MTFKAKIVCNACLDEKEFNTEDPWTVEIEINEIIEDGKWLFDEENDSHYCPKCAPMAVEELEVEYGK